MKKSARETDNATGHQGLDLEEKVWRLAEIIAAARRIHSSLALGPVLSSFLETAVSELGSSGGCIYLRDSKSDDIIPRQHLLTANLTSPQKEGGLHEARKAMQQNRMIIDHSGKTGFDPVISLALRDESGVSIGVLQIYRDDALDPSNGDRLFLRELSHFAALSIRNAQYHEDSLTKARLERELAVARQIQMNTFPKEMPQLPGYDLAGASRPAEETGGDTFDLIPLKDQAVMLLLGDATGHGIGPALSVTQVRSMLRVATRVDVGLDDAFQHINNQLCEDLAENLFVTAFLGVLDGKSHQVRYHAGGQAPLMHFRAASGEFAWLQSSTIPLGFYASTGNVECRYIDLAPGDILGLITDGLYEGKNSAGLMFGTERVESIVRNKHGAASADIVRAIFEAFDGHRQAEPQADDITIVLARRCA